MSPARKSRVQSTHHSLQGVLSLLFLGLLLAYSAFLTFRRHCTDDAERRCDTLHGRFSITLDGKTTGKLRADEAWWQPYRVQLFDATPFHERTIFWPKGLATPGHRFQVGLSRSRPSPKHPDAVVLQPAIYLRSIRPQRCPARRNFPVWHLVLAPRGSSWCPDLDDFASTTVFGQGDEKALN